MSDDAPDELTALARAVLDGEPVDWESARAATPPDAWSLVARLRTLERIAEACRAEVLGTWGGLRLLERIGAGTFGEVYRAWDPRLDRHVALKLLPAEPEATILEEGRRLARVRHPNVVTIHGAERIDDRVGLWMEFVDGRTLHDLVVIDGRRFTALDAVAIGRTLCAAVGAVHDAGLLHRDITARNVMLTGEGRVVLMDFGSGRDLEQMRAGELAGTPLYLAPEVLSGGAPPSVRSDIYSIGVLLFFLVTGSFPVIGADLDGLRLAHANRESRPSRDVLDRLPASLRRAVESAIDPVPGCRPPTAAALALALNDSGARPMIARWMTVVVLLLAAGLAASGDRRRWFNGDGIASPASARAADTPQRRDEFRRAWVLTEREGVAGPAQAASVFARLLAADPAYAPAHAGLALTDAYLSMTPYQGRSLESVHTAMRSHAAESLRLDPDLPEGHVARGWVLAREHEWTASEQAFREAIRLNPRLTAGYTGLVYATLQPLGREADAELLLRQALQLEPLANHVLLALGRVLIQANRAADAVAVLEPARRTDSDLLFVDLYLGRALLLDGRVAESLPLLERRRARLVDTAAAPEPWLAWAYVALGRRAEAEALAVKYDHLPFRRAVINGALGRDDRMFHGLEQMAEREPQRLPQLLRAPELAPFRLDPRFRRLVERLRLADAPW